MELHSYLKQSIELFFFYYANGTLDWQLLKDIDYRAASVANPDLFWQSSYVFIDSILKERKDTYERVASWLKEQLEDSSKAAKDKPHEVIDFDHSSSFFPYAFTCMAYKLVYNLLTSDMARYDSFFKEIMINRDPDFLQRIACIWTNNLQITPKGIVLNKEYAEKRVGEYILWYTGSKEPEKKFEEWEVIHNT